MVHDKKNLGVCSETQLGQCIITMMQVYEYYISLHMARAFESLFGSVICLPGCFTLYHLRTPDTHKPLLISNEMAMDYSSRSLVLGATLRFLLFFDAVCRHDCSRR